MKKPPPSAAGLPLSGQVDVNCLAQSLERANASYKFLLLKIILQRVEKQAGAEEISISFDAIRREMLILSWFPIRHFRLHFGTSDMIGSVLQDLTDKRKEGIITSEAFTSTDQVRNSFAKVADSLAELTQVKNLTHHPLYVMINPWFRDETKGMIHYKAYKLITKLSNERFADTKNPPLYRIDMEQQRIVVHHRWRAYFEDNQQIINGWLDSQWLRYLASCNPNVPSLSNKLWELPDRRSLARQRKYWRYYMKGNELRCLYSNQSLDDRNYHLDHFLPWTWIGHDQLWNLVPANPNINSSKSNLLPSAEQINALSDMHLKFLTFTNEQLSETVWQRWVDDYVVGLSTGFNDLLKKENLANAYDSTIKAQLALARRQGFEDWKQRR